MQFASVEKLTPASNVDTRAVALLHPTDEQVEDVSSPLVTGVPVRGPVDGTLYGTNQTPAFQNQGILLSDPRIFRQTVGGNVQMYPFTTMLVKPKYMPVQLPGGPAIDLPPYNPEAPYATWNDGLCDCFKDCSVCMEVALCPQRQAIAQGCLMSKGDANPGCGWYILYWLLDAVSAFFITPAIAADVRVRVAQYFNINTQNHSSECLQGYFCCCLSLCQTYRELKARGVNPAVWCHTGGVNHMIKTAPMQ